MRATMLPETRRHRVHLTIAALCALLWLVGCTSSTPDDTAPIRVLRVGHADLDAFKKSIEASVRGCQLFKNQQRKQPPAALRLPPDADLLKFVVAEDEELFNGVMWARFHTQRTIAADVKNGCQPAVYIHRDANVERTCDWRLHGSSLQIIDMVGLETLQSVETPPSVYKEKLPQATCKAKPPATLDTTGLPVEDAGAARCIWATAIAARTAQAAASPNAQPTEADAATPDFCFYDKKPYYAYQGTRRELVLKIRGAKKTAGGQPIAELLGEVAAVGQELAAFSDGPALPEAKFTREAMEAFLRQPAKQPLGAGR
ncbi:MAG TPA: hypothetical protein VE029_12535 [Rhizobacter sp.]|nr:hypothetical protein [Rhizobacter sp.]